MWACRGGVRQPQTGCGHAEVGFDSLELRVSNNILVNNYVDPIHNDAGEDNVHLLAIEGHACI